MTLNPNAAAADVGLAVNAARTTRLICAAVAAIAIAGCGSTPAEPVEPTAAERQWRDARGRVLLRMAEDELAAGRLDAARDACDRAVAANGGATADLLSARIDIERDAISAAAATLAEGRQRADLPPEAAAEMAHLDGVVAERLGDPAAAATHHGAAVELRPNDPALLVAAAEALVADTRVAEAADLIETHLPHHAGEPAVHDALGQIRQTLGRHAEAADAFARAAALSPEDAGVRQRLAVATWQSGDARAALPLLERAADEDDAPPALRLALGECRLVLNDATGAAETFTAAARLDRRSPVAWLGVAKASLQAGDLPRADAALDRAAELSPGDADARLLRAYLRLRQGRAGEASRLLAGADPADDVAAALLARCRLAAAE